MLISERPKLGLVSVSAPRLAFFCILDLGQKFTEFTNVLVRFVLGLGAEIGFLRSLGLECLGKMPSQSFTSAHD